MKDTNKEENVKLDIIKDKKKDKKVYRYFLVSVFIKKLKEDKLYLVSFIITVIACCVFSVTRVQDAEGMFSESKNKDTDKINNGQTISDDKVDLSKYEGFYTKSFKLNNSIAIDGDCSFKEYKYIYKIDNDSKISKYMNNKCTGVTLVYEDTITYKNGGNVLNIGTKDRTFIVSGKELKEIDGYSYSFSKTIDKLDVNDTKIDLEYSDDDILIMTKHSLYLLSGNTLLGEVSVKNRVIEQTMYKSKTNKNTYNYIVFSDDANKSCYPDEDINNPNFVDGTYYSIYSVTFDNRAKRLSESTHLISRNKSDGCSKLEEDLAIIVK